jgi:hypothetical protein
MPLLRPQERQAVALNNYRLGKHGLEGVLLGWSLQNYPFGLACLFHGPASHPHLSTTTGVRNTKGKFLR